MITTILGTKFTKQTENSTKRCSSNAQKVGNSSIHENNMKHGILMEKGFVPLSTPDIAKEEILKGIGFNPRGDESNVYAIEDTDTCLVATAEITLGGYHADEILAKEKLPIKYAGISHCFRKEAGAAGQFSKGLYRVHQFTKLEMFVYCTPEESDTLHEKRGFYRRAAGCGNECVTPWGQAGGALFCIPL